VTVRREAVHTKQLALSKTKKCCTSKGLGLRLVDTKHGGSAASSSNAAALSSGDAGLICMPPPS